MDPSMPGDPTHPSAPPEDAFAPPSCEELLVAVVHDDLAVSVENDHADGKRVEQRL